MKEAFGMPGRLIRTIGTFVQRIFGIPIPEIRILLSGKRKRE